MQFDAPIRPPKAESIVPMINVVFLLLIFFLMTAQIAPPDPFEVTPPEATAAAEPQAELMLYLNADGVLAFEDHRGAAVLAALSTQVMAADGHAPHVVLRADAAGQGARLAEVMAQLRGIGVGAVELVVTAP
ncbi:ExbD/TolR family protein [Thalassovita mediterranea]|jgi:biopolymer transport protein ExbD|uniref:Biopolymer transport protein ExbD n=1 Tax=Thalassovita mediterranea TaxID=340021 RepID=A0A0N7M2F1_9RHOB|nr:biopolymer transporter ExbD [Thalassovita mediterranea]CUH85931.1 biopolymer transport protein ExbD [Thalassovita mediterranea]SIS32847.1 outer membrane transport energization protein ExbD [Thalassovita mediterranea]